jgi:transposase
MSADNHYPTELTDEQWALLQIILPQPVWRPGGPGRLPWDLRLVINGIWYLNKTGCQWRMVPREFGHWSIISGYFKRWRHDGVWAGVMATRRQWECRCLGRQPEPSAGSIDAQSIKTATQHEDSGFDGIKKIKGASGISWWTRWS